MHRAVALCGVLLVVILVALLGAIEGIERFDLGHDIVVVGVAGIEFGDERLGLFLLVVAVREDRRAVLRAHIRSLPVELGRVVNGEKHLEQVAVADLVGVVLDLDDLGMACVAGTDLSVRRIGHVAAGVAGDSRLDTGELLERGLDTPETAATERRRLGCHTADRNSAG
jgi:hypothetical protein